MGGVNNLYLLDWEGTISYPKKPFLEEFGWRILRKSPPHQKICLLGVVVPMIYTAKWISKENKEKILFNLFEYFGLSLTKPKYNLLKEESQKYNNYVLREAEEFLRDVSKQEENKICIISTTIKEIIDDYLRDKKIENIDVYANKFLTHDGDIRKFQYPLISDRIGKFEKSIEIIKKCSPKRIIGSGDSNSDIGIAQISDFFYTHKNADLDLREYVERKFGKEFIYNSPKDMFEDLKNLI